MANVFEKVCSNKKCCYKGQLQSIRNFNKRGKGKYKSHCKECDKRMRVERNQKKAQANKMKELSKLGNLKRKTAFIELDNLEVIEEKNNTDLDALLIRLMDEKLFYYLFDGE